MIDQPVPSEERQEVLRGLLDAADRIARVGYGDEHDVIVSFEVRGDPVAQGSPRAFIVGKGTDRERAQVVSGAKGKGSHGRSLAGWRSDVKKAAVEAMGDRLPVAGPVALELQFIMGRPASHHVAGDRSRPLKANAPRWCDKRPDVGKLARAVEDALSSVVYVDDNQVVDLHPTKPYGFAPGVRVTVRTMT